MLPMPSQYVIWVKGDEKRQVSGTDLWAGGFRRTAVLATSEAAARQYGAELWGVPISQIMVEVPE